MRYSKGPTSNITLYQGEWIKHARPIAHPELFGATAESGAAKLISDMFISLRGAVAFAGLTQARQLVYIVGLQRIQQPKNILVRRLSAIARRFLPMSGLCQ